jgi:hypothetical protein
VVGFITQKEGLGCLQDFKIKLYMNFNKIVKNILGSTFSMFGFFLKKEYKGLVEYEHKDKVLMISISYDFSRSFEVDLNFYFKANNTSYNLSELKEYFNKNKNQFIAIQILNDAKLKVWIQEVKVFLEKHIDELVKNNIKICFELNGLREHNVIDYNNDREAKIFKKDIDKYWNDKNYVRLIECVNNYKGIIEGSLKKKFEYALKKK